MAKIKLGEKSTTLDGEGEKTKIDIKIKPTIKDIKKILNSFTGKILQKPPIFSAIKVAGKEAYKYARRGLKIELKPRQVEIKQIEFLEYNWPFLSLRVVTGPGVYIRSLAQDIGDKLNTGG